VSTTPPALAHASNTQGGFQRGRSTL
jgi:hypothetical protein